MESISKASRHPHFSFRKARCSAGNMECLSTCCRSSLVITAVSNLYPVLRHVMGLYWSGFPTHPGLGIRTVLPFTNQAGSFRSVFSTSRTVLHRKRLSDGKLSTRKCKGHPFQEPSSTSCFSELTSILQGRALLRLEWECSEPLRATHGRQGLPEHSLLAPQGHHSNTQKSDQQKVDERCSRKPHFASLRLLGLDDDTARSTTCVSGSS